MDRNPNNSCSFNEITYGAKRIQQSIESHTHILDKFYVGFEQAKILKGDANIFLDTNVLLKSYSTSFKAREKLLQFFKDFKSRNNTDGSSTIGICKKSRECNCPSLAKM